MGVPAEKPASDNPTEQPSSSTAVQTNFVGSSTGQPLKAPTEPNVEPPPVVDSAQTTEGKSTTGDEESTTGDLPVVGHGGKEMTPEAISKRVERGQRSMLRQLFGTEDLEEAKKLAEKAKTAGTMSAEQQREFESLKRKEEARKRSLMTREQRQTAERDRLIQERDEARQRLQEREETEVVQNQDRVVEQAASSHIDSTYMPYAKRDFAEYAMKLSNENPEQFKKFGPKQVERWFEKYVATRPAFAIKSNETVPAKPESPKQPPVKRSVTTTRTAARTPSPAVIDGPGMANGKTVKPGQPNSMNKSELREYFKSQGMKYPG